MRFTISVASLAISLCALQLPAGRRALPLHPRNSPLRLAVTADVATLEQQLLDLAYADESPPSAVLAAFEALEASAPAPADLLDTAAGRTLVDGRWKLVATIAAQVGDDDLAASGTGGVVNASGLPIDTRRERKPVQVVDVAGGRIANEVQTFGGRLMARVEGSLDPSGKRAYIEFDNLEFKSADGAATYLTVGWLFSLIRKVRPALQNGADAQSWLDTTYLSERVRLGRGNKGSIFVLER